MARPIRAARKVQVKPSDERTSELQLLPHENEWNLMSAAAITAVTVFEEVTPGSMNLTSLYDRVALIVKKNPWLTGRLRMMPEGVRLYYGKHFVDCFQAVTRTGKFSYDMTYEEVVSVVRPYVVKTGQECIDREESLFKVSVLVHGEEKRQFLLVFSVSSLIADVHTMYKLYHMMSSSEEGKSLVADRNFDFGKTLLSTLGKAEVKWLQSSSSKQTGQSLSMRIWPRPSCRVHYLDTETWLPHAKKTHAVGSNWVSTNDVLTSWFFSIVHCDFALMKVNFRNRMLDLGDLHAGNYSENILFRPEDFDRPLLIRKALSGYRRAAQLESRYRKQPHGTSLPGIWTALKNNSAAIENWSGAYKNVTIAGCSQMLHLPIIVEHDVVPYRNMMIVFKPTDGAIAMLTFERDAVMLDEEYNPRRGTVLRPAPSDSRD